MSFDEEGAPPSLAPGFVGRPAIDERGTKIGTVTDVLTDDRTGEVTWAVVSLGFMHTEHYVPLMDAYQTETGRVVLGFDRETVKRSPRASREHVLGRDEAQMLADYYNVAA